MNNFDEIIYSNNFLDQVIIRIDFTKYIENIFTESLEKSISNIFPKIGKTQIIRYNSVNFSFDNEYREIQNANKKSFDGFQKEYFDSKKNNKIVLSNKFLAFEINEYESFDFHIKSFKEILFLIFKESNPIIARTGLRYINKFNPKKIKIQKNFFSPHIAATLQTKFTNNCNNISLIRSMHLAEYKTNSMKLNYRYGMFNPDFPNILKKNSFALDLDCFVMEQLTKAEDVLSKLSEAHTAIQYLFEKSITDSLRKVMKHD